MDWENIRHFSAFSIHGSLSAAARTLGVEHATVARRITALESELSLKLVDRRGRRLKLTSEGKRIAEIADRMRSNTATIARTAASARDTVEGSVTISAPPSFAAVRLVKPLVALRALHPGLDVRLVGETRTASLENSEADLSIRLSRPDHGDLTIVKLGEMPFRFYAARAYLDSVRQADWTFVGYDGVMATAPQEMKLRNFAGSRRVAFQANTAEIQLAAVRAGAGVAILPDFLAADDGLLTCVAPGDPAFVREIWAVVHSDVKGLPAIRAVIDALKASFTD